MPPTQVFKRDSSEHEIAFFRFRGELIIGDAVERPCSFCGTETPHLAYAQGNFNNGGGDTWFPACSTCHGVKVPGTYVEHPETQRLVKGYYEDFSEDHPILMITEPK